MYGEDAVYSGEMNRFTTTRLLVRPLQLADSGAVFDYRSDPAVMRFQMWHPASEREVRQFIREQRGLTPGLPGHWFQFGIVEQSSGRLLGDCGLHTPLSTPDSVEVGLTLRPDCQRQGYATEVLTALIHYCFTTLHVRSVIARTHPDNLRSIRLVSRCGFPTNPVKKHDDELTFVLDHGTWQQSENPEHPASH